MAIDCDLDGWRIVSLIFLRSRTVARGVGDHAGVIEFRARMLAE